MRFQSFPRNPQLLERVVLAPCYLSKARVRACTQVRVSGYGYRGNKVGGQGLGTAYSRRGRRL